MTSGLDFKSPEAIFKLLADFKEECVLHRLTQAIVITVICFQNFKLKMVYMFCGFGGFLFGIFFFFIGFLGFFLS